MSHKYVYLFSEGNAKMRELLGGKGANLAEMTNIGLPVPQGFTISTEACTQYYEDGRRINDEMGSHVARRAIKLMTQRGVLVGEARVLVLGLAFKENCPDVRNTRVVDVIAEFRSYQARVDVYDPWVSKEEAHAEYGLELVEKPEPGAYDVIILAVSHREFLALGAAGIRAFGKPRAVLFDVKQALPKDATDGRL